LQINLETFSELQGKHNEYDEREGKLNMELVETRLVKDEEPVIKVNDSEEQPLIHVIWKTEVHLSMFGTVMNTDKH